MPDNVVQMANTDGLARWFGAKSEREARGHPITHSRRPDQTARTRACRASAVTILSRAGRPARRNCVEGGVAARAGSPSTQAWRAGFDEAAPDLAGLLIEAQEAERARLAREIHDDFSQRLALLAVKVDCLRQAPPGDAEAVRTALDTLHVDVQALAKDVHCLSHHLHPARLTQLGLPSAVRALCAEITAAHGVAVRCDTADVPRDVPARVALCLYRVAQEALQNVVKHSGAGAAVVELRRRARKLYLFVTDDGGGFDAAASNWPGGLGLVSMGERVRLIGGRLAVSSAPGEGTRIRVEARVC